MVHEEANAQKMEQACLYGIIRNLTEINLVLDLALEKIFNRSAL